MAPRPLCNLCQLVCFVFFLNESKFGHRQRRLLKWSACPLRSFHLASLMSPVSGIYKLNDMGTIPMSFKIKNFVVLIHGIHQTCQWWVLSGWTTSFSPLADKWDSFFHTKFFMDDKFSLCCKKHALTLYFLFYFWVPFECH